MNHAVVLIEADRDVLSTLGGAMADIDGVAEETRIGMLVGVAVGFELARELARSTHESEGD